MNVNHTEMALSKRAQMMTTAKRKREAGSSLPRRDEPLVLAVLFRRN
jgi:hypothetical protein